MNWNAVGFAVVMLLLVVDLVLLVRSMGSGRGIDANARIEAAASRVERACAAHGRIVESSLREIAEKPSSRRRARLWGEPGVEDLDCEEGGMSVCYEGPDSSDASEILEREMRNAPAPSVVESPGRSGPTDRRRSVG